MSELIRAKNEAGETVYLQLPSRPDNSTLGWIRQRLWFR